MGSRRPPFVLLENVAGFLTSHGGKDFGEALLALNRLGYNVDAFFLDAAWFVPQSRVRLFVVAVKDPSHLADGITHIPQDWIGRLRPRPLVEFVNSHPEIVWSIRPIPEPNETESDLTQILDDLPDDAPEWWSSARADYLLNQMSEKHRRIANGMIRGEEWSYGTVFRRVRRGKSMAELRTDGIAGCLRTPRGGSGRQILFKAGHGRHFARLITPRECARLMGADDFSITVPLNQALFGFGDAVCVPVIEWIAQYYLNPLAGEMIRGVPLKAVATE
jgi:DNA (cytosine-5)-methyltransferase 1